MRFPDIKITKRKNGQKSAWFRDTQGRVRTALGPVNWFRAGQLRELADFGIALQKEQAARGLGSDGAPMPPLKNGPVKFAGRRGGVATFQKKIRNLYGPGKDGHMLDDIRVNYLDDRRVQISITRRSSRIKALANERRAPWWGWSSESIRRLSIRAAELFELGVGDMLVGVGLTSGSSRGRRSTGRAA